MSRERYQLHATLNKQPYTIHPECINTLLLKTCKRFVNFAVGARSDDLERPPVDGRSLLKVRYPRSGKFGLLTSAAKREAPGNRSCNS